MSTNDPKTVALMFNDCINNRDLNSLVELMTDDHSFIDIAENIINGNLNCKKAWKDFFNSFPDYQNIFKTVISIDDFVIIEGYSNCSDKRLEGHEIWTARIRDNKVSEWRVYEDNEENRQKLKLTTPC